eukprot:TRINITY_DN48533_c0_g1_i1.p1 TRINITY_DN48533_c0_g1~~TRINITY_DN48533_c0_g1_i1.p1  ORF type:complete len:345 (-),score=70.49 TRINITY_DN48533_c0_g1_i1:195-1229(-)
MGRGSYRGNGRPASAPLRRSSRSPSPFHDDSRGSGGFHRLPSRRGRGHVDDQDAASVRLDGLPPDIERIEIQELCLKFGAVLDVEILSGRCESDACALVLFANAAAAREAVHELRGAFLFDSSAPISAAIVNVHSTRCVRGREDGKERDRNGRDASASRSRCRLPRRQRSQPQAPSVPSASPPSSQGSKSRSVDRAAKLDDFAAEKRPSADCASKPAVNGVAATSTTKPAVNGVAATNTSVRVNGDSVPTRPEAADVKQNVSKYRQGQVRVNLWQLPDDFEEDELLEVASDYGAIRTYELWSELKQKCAMIEFESKESAMAALDGLHNRKMEGWHKPLKLLVCD